MGIYSFVFKPLIIIGLLLVSHPLLIFGQEQNESVEERIQKLETENKELRDIIDLLKNRLDKLEDKTPQEKKKKEKVSNKEKSESQTGVDTESKESSEDEEDDEWLPSLKGETFRLGGRMQAEFFKRENDIRFQSAIPDNEGGSFHIDEVRLYLDADFKNKVRFHSKIDIEGDKTGIIEAYIEAEDLPLNSTLLAGMHPRFFRPDRYTESFPLTGVAFWRSRDIGITAKSTYEPVSVYFSIVNGVELDSQEIGEDESAFIIGENDNGIDLNGNKEFSGGLGIEYDFDDFGKIEVIGFGVVGELSNDDVLFLQSRISGYGSSVDDSKMFAGANLDYSIEEWDFFAQFITGEDGEIDRTSWYTELSYKWKIDGLKYLNSLRPLVRYSVLDVDYPPQPFIRNGSLTWDRRQWLFGLVSEIVDHVNFRFEYMLNDEDTGGPSVNNDEFLFQMEIEF